MTPLNDELIDEVLARIERDPAQWDQGDFFSTKRTDGKFCGTTACFAGHALLASGWTMELKESDFSPYGHGVVVRDPSGKPNHDYDGEAAKLLGFTEIEANQIFYCTQTESVAEMREAIDLIRARRTETQES